MSLVSRTERHLLYIVVSRPSISFLPSSQQHSSRYSEPHRNSAIIPYHHAKPFPSYIRYHHALHHLPHHAHCFQRSSQRRLSLLSPASRQQESERIHKRKLVRPSPTQSRLFSPLTSSQRARHGLLRASKQLQRRRDHGRHQPLCLFRRGSMVLLRRQNQQWRILRGQSARGVEQ